MPLSADQTKIVATVGPASSSPVLLKKLIERGVDVFRLNFAHGTTREHAAVIRSIRRVSASTGPVGVLVDLPGPKIRVTSVPGKELVLKRGDRLVIAPRFQAAAICVSYPRLAGDVAPGDTVFIADGVVRIRVERVTGGRLHGRVLNGGVVRRGNGVNFPGSAMSLRAFTRQDERHLQFALEHGVDFIGVSFVGCKDDVVRVKAFCAKRRANPFVIAKIERRQAIERLDEIIAHADGVMVARGDLGVEVPFDQIPALQTQIIARARFYGKPVIVATQVLESMVRNPSPTRAEATDIAHAVREGADAIMLSAESSIGQYPAEAVQALRKVIKSEEAVSSPACAEWPRLRDSVSMRIAEVTCRLANQLGAKVIVVPTVTGKTAERLSSFRPRVPVLALTSNRALRRRLTLFGAIQSLPIGGMMRYHNAVPAVRAAFQRKRILKKGELAVVVSGSSGLLPGETGTIQLIRM